jgi:hypothetical protein
MFARFARNRSSVSRKSLLVPSDLKIEIASQLGEMLSLKSSYHFITVTGAWHGEMCDV